MRKHPSQCPKNHYLVNGTCCQMCPAGTHKLRDCTASAETQCEPCENGTYTEHENSLSKCQPCSYCKGMHLTEASHCNHTHDAQCQCANGFYCPLRNRGKSTCDFCNAVSPCPLGLGVLKSATSWADTMCEICQNGTFSNVTDTFSPCLTHTKCPELGLVLKLHGTTSTDSVCVTHSTTTSLSWCLSLPLLIIALALITVLWKHPCRKGSTLRLPALGTVDTHQLDNFISLKEGVETERLGHSVECGLTRSLFPTQQEDESCLQREPKVLEGEGQRKLNSNIYHCPFLRPSPAPCKELDKSSAGDETVSLPITVKCMLSAEMVHSLCPSLQSVTMGGPRGHSLKSAEEDNACGAFCTEGTESPVRTLENTYPVSPPTLTASQNFNCDSYCKFQPGLETGVNPCSSWAPPCELRSHLQERPSWGRPESSQPEEDEWKE